MITNIKDQLRRDEGDIPYAYTDSLGYITIGTGVCIDHRKGCYLYPEEDDFILNNRISIINTTLQKYLPWTENLDPIRFAVLVNMVYNLGFDGFIGFHQMLSCAEVGNYTSAATEMLKSKWAMEVGARAQRLSEQMKTGVWV